MNPKPFVFTQEDLGKALDKLFEYKPPDSLRQQIYDTYKAGVITKKHADDLCEINRLYPITGDDPNL